MDICARRGKAVNRITMDFPDSIVNPAFSLILDQGGLRKSIQCAGVIPCASPDGSGLGLHWKSLDAAIRPSGHHGH